MNAYAPPSSSSSPVLVAPVELVGFARREDQRNIVIGGCAALLERLQPAAKVGGPTSRMIGPCRLPKVRYAIRRVRCLVGAVDSDIEDCLLPVLKYPALTVLHSHRLQRLAPGDEVIEHGVDRRRLMRTGLERGKILEIGKKR